MLERTETSVAFNLDRLIEFNPAIAYCFDPETSPEGLFAEKRTFRNSILPEAPQYQDMLDAYLYAQDVLLPAFHNMEEAPISAEWLLEQLNILHSKIAKTVHSNLRLTAGKYTSDIILRWHAGCDLASDIIILDKQNHHRQPSQEQIAKIESEYNLRDKHLPDFIQLIYRLREDAAIPIITSKDTLKPDHPAYTGTLLFNKLCVAYHSEVLTETEKRLVDGIVTICQPPETLPAAMAAYAQITLVNLRACDRKNLDKIALFLAESFFQLTEIHPYPNGNGRLATCVMNVFLRYFNLPSILLRLPGESSDARSLYSIAIEGIRETREPLAHLIKNRILDIRARGEFVDEELKTITSLRVTMSERMQMLLKFEPRFNLESLLDEGSMPILISATFAKKGENERTTLQCKEILRLVNVHIEQSREKNSSSARTAAGFSLTGPQFTTEERPQIIKALNDFATLSGGWGLDIKANTFWTQSDDRAAVQALLDKLKENHAENVTLCRRKDNAKIWVVTFKDVAFARKQLEKTTTAAHGAGVSMSAAAVPR